MVVGWLSSRRKKAARGWHGRLWRIADLQNRYRSAEGKDPELTAKVPLMYSIDDPTAIVAFEVEQMIMPKLKGKHVPRYFGSGRFDTQPFIVMEHIAGLPCEVVLMLRPAD